MIGYESYEMPYRHFSDKRRNQSSIKCYLTRIVLELGGQVCVAGCCTNTEFQIRHLTESTNRCSFGYQVSQPYNWSVSLNYQHSNETMFTYHIDFNHHPVFVQAFVKKLEISKRAFLWILDPNMTNVS